jgi:hypothetical protein
MSQADKGERTSSDGSKELVMAQMEEVQKAFVAISVAVPEGTSISSGFVVDLGTWILVTAEHVIEGDGGVKDLMLREGARLELLALDDKAQSVTFRLPEVYASTSQLAQAQGVSEDEAQVLREMDLVGIPLSDLYVKQLQYLGVKPLRYNHVSSMTKAEAANLIEGQDVLVYLVGIPRELTRIVKDGEMLEITVQPLQVEPHSLRDPFNYWMPAYSKDEGPYDVKGMSGGPLVALGLKEPHVLAVQSAQDYIHGKRVFKAVSSAGFFSFLKAVGEGANRLSGTPIVDEC